MIFSLEEAFCHNIPLTYMVTAIGVIPEMVFFGGCAKKTHIENPARGIAKITKHGNIQCIAGHNMVFLTKDCNLDSYIFSCPVLNEEARKKLEKDDLRLICFDHICGG